MLKFESTNLADLKTEIKDRNDPALDVFLAGAEQADHYDGEELWRHESGTWFLVSRYHIEESSVFLEDFNAWRPLWAVQQVALRLLLDGFCVEIVQKSKGKYFE